MKRKILLAIFTFLLILAIEGITRADTPSIDTLSAKTDWVVHFDMQQIRESIPEKNMPSVDFILSQVFVSASNLGAASPSEDEVKQLQQVQKVLKSFNKLNYITVSGPATEEAFIIQVCAKYDQAKLRKSLKIKTKATRKLYKKQEYFAYNKGEQAFVVAFIGEDKIFSSNSEQSLKNQIDIHQKTGKTLSENSELAKLFTKNKGVFFTAALTKFDKIINPDSERELAALDKIKTFYLELRINKCKSLKDLIVSSTCKVIADSNKNAVRLSKIYEGFIAMLELNKGADITFDIVFDSIAKKSKVSGKCLTVDWSLKYKTVQKKFNDLLSGVGDMFKNFKFKPRKDAKNQPQDDDFSSDDTENSNNK